MKLEEGIYEIQDDCTVYIRQRKVIIQKMKAKARAEKPHCKDCIHQLIGRKSMRNQYWDCPYCELKPKVISGKGGYFYAANNYHPTCEKFEPKQRP